MKKSLKKSLFLLLTLLSILFIVACGEKAEKKEVIEKFVENSKNIKSTDVSASMKMEQKNSTGPAGMSMEVSGNMSIILEPKLSMKMDLTIPATNNKLSMYLKDGYSYVQNPGDGQWIKQSNKEFEEQFKKVYAQSNLVYDFLIKNLDKIDLEEKGGNYLLIIKNVKDIIKKDFSALDPTGKGLEGYEDIVVTFTVDKKTFLPVNFSMKGAINEGTLNMNFLFDLKYSNINNVKEIIVPKEALEAKESMEVLEEQLKEAEKAQKDNELDKK